MRRTVTVFLAFALVGSAAFGAEAKRLNRLIELFERGDAAVGIYVGARAPNVARVVGNSGLDFFIVDMEHDVYDYREVQRFLLHVSDAHRYPIGDSKRPTPVPLVKIAHRGTWDPQYDVAASFKAGPVLGVMVPFVESRADLEKAVAAARVPEQLHFEGLGREERRRRLDVWPLNPDGEILVVAMIESPNGVRNIEEIVDTPGLGVLHLTHVPEEEEARLLKLCLDRGVVCGRGETDPSRVGHWIEMGYRFIDLGWDYRLLERELEQTLETARGKRE